MRRVPFRLSLPLSIAAALAAAVIVAAQAPATFEVASIRRNAEAQRGLAGPQPGGRFIGLGVTLHRLVSDAYDGLEVEGGPPWATKDRFDVNARAEGNPTAAQLRRMLRQLLADRFALVVRTQKREMPVYTLTNARPGGLLGPKLQRSDAKCAAEAVDFFPGTSPGFPPPCGDYRLGARALTARGMTMGGLARLLAGLAGRPGLDHTGLDGFYDLELEWSSDLGLRQAPPDAAGAGELKADGLSIFTALQEQLGLKLEPRRGPVDVVVIERAEPPTEN
jgi:uncharacterized protein (TIGR03435 family)